MKKWYKRPGPVFSAAGMTMLIAVFTSCYVHDSRLEYRFEDVSQGMNEQQVFSLLGKPDTKRSCDHVVGYPNDCSREHLYNAELPTITQWSVFFNEHGIVVGKYRYESP